MTNIHTNFLNDYSRFLDSSGRHLTYAALSLYCNFKEELSEKEMRFLKAHLDSCSECLQRLQEVKEIEGGEKQSKLRTVSKMSAAIIRYAIAAVLVVALGITVYFTVMEKPQEESAVKNISPEHSIAQAPPNPAKFIPNQVLENFIERTVRSSSKIKLLSPEIGDTLTVPFTFKWSGTKKGESVTVTIVDNNNADVWKNTTSSSTLILGNALQPGLYYVKLEVNEKLVSVGKFVVAR